MTLAFWVYQALTCLAFGVGWPALLVKALSDPRYRTGWRERLGLWTGLFETGEGEKGPIWVHGASLGEVQAAAPLVSALRERGARLLLTATSPAGREAARSQAGDAGTALLLPLDLAPLMAGAFRAARPAALVVVETELWPALLRAAQRSAVPALLINGRISDRAFPRYRRMRRWTGPLLTSFASIQARSCLDAERFLALGASPELITVGGNLKYDLPPPDPASRETSGLRRARAGGWRVLVGGSTHPGEEEALFAAADVLESEGLRLGLVLAPRRLERVEEVEAVGRARGRRMRRWSELRDPLERDVLAAFSSREAIVVDRYGLLGSLYGGAEVAFVGGTLVPVGGHNLLEPVNWGVPVLFGPHTENARDVAAEILRSGLGEEVPDSKALAGAARRFFSDRDRLAAVRDGAGRLFEQNRGAVARALAALEQIGIVEPGGRG